MQDSTAHEPTHADRGRRFASLSRFCYRRWYVIVPLYVLVAVAAVVLTKNNIGRTLAPMNLVTINNSNSAAAFNLNNQKFLSAVENGTLFFQSKKLTVDDPAYKQAVDNAVAAMGKAPALKDIIQTDQLITPYNPPVDALKKLISTDRHSMLAILPVFSTSTDVTAHMDDLVNTAQAASTPQVSVNFVATLRGTAAVATDISKAVGSSVVLIALIVIVVVLVIASGSLLGWIPGVLSGVLAMLISIGGVVLAGNWLTLNVLGLAVIAFLCLALGIDFCVYVEHRFQQALIDGADRKEAITVAAATAGRAVTLSALLMAAVALPLFLFPAVTYRSYAAAGMIAFLVLSVCAATLVPALLGMFGGSLVKARFPWLKNGKTVDSHAMTRVLGVPMRHPAIFSTLAIVLLLLVALPAFKLDTLVGGTNLLSKDDPMTPISENLSSTFTPGLLAPIIYVVETNRPALDDPATYQQIQELSAKVAKDPDTWITAGPVDVVTKAGGAVALPVSPAQLSWLLDTLRTKNLGAVQNVQKNGLNSVVPPPSTPEAEQLAKTAGRLLVTHAMIEGMPGVAVQASAYFQGNYVTLTLFGRPAPDTERASAYIGRLRNYGNQVFGKSNLNGKGFVVRGKVFTGGMVAQGVDVNTATRQWLPWILLLMGLILFVLLSLALRAPLLVAIGVVAELLVVLATLGTLVMAFQWGWFPSLVPHMGFVEAEVPGMLLPVIFGVSSCYLAVVLSRISSVPVSDLTPRVDILRALVRSSRASFTGSVVLFVLFGSLVFTGQPLLQVIGFGFAAAILLDGILVRGMLLPAAVGRFGARINRSIVQERIEERRTARAHEAVPHEEAAATIIEAEPPAPVYQQPGW